MTEDVTVDAPAEAVVEPTPADPGVSLELIDRNLTPIRRLVAYGSEHPDEVRFVSDNVGRWLDPILLAELPESLRELFVAVSGLASGIDALDVEARLARLQKMRATVFQIDRLFGLPLPQSRRPRPRGRTDQPKPSRERPKPKPKVKAREERDNTPPRRKERTRSAFWNGNPHVGVDTLAVDVAFVTALAEAGLHTVRDVLLTAPVGEEVLRPIHGAGREIEPGRVAVGGRLRSRCTVLAPDGSRRAEAVLVGAGPMRLRWADQDATSGWLSALGPGERAVAVGEWDGDVLQEPEFVVEDGKSVRLPRYGLAGVDDQRMHALVFRLLPYLDNTRDPLAASQKAGRISLSDAIRALHGRGDAGAARARLAYDEALMLAVGLGWERMAQRVRGIQHPVLHGAADRLLGGQHVRLDDRQQRALEDIKRDMRRARPMRRVLCGEPGGGKGLIALLTAVSVAEGKTQVLWLTPDEASAEFAFTFYEPLLRSVGLVGRIAGPKPSASTRDAARRGEIHVLFGSTSLLQAGVEFRRLGLVISSERPEVSSEEPSQVAQAVDALKAPRPDALVLPVLPLSASELLIGWPTHDVTMLAGARPPQVVVRPASRRDAAYAPARRAVEQGHQAIVLFPQIQGRDALDLDEATRVVEALASDALKSARIALLHGSMSREERQRVVTDMIQRRADALVSTLPLEDGPPIPAHTITVVEHADRMNPERIRRLMGLRAHQISLVVQEGLDEEATEALVTLASGAGLPADVVIPWDGLRFLDLREDLETVVQARTVAFDRLTADAGLKSGRSADWVRSMRAGWAEVFGDKACPLPEPTESGERKRRRRRRRRR